MAFKKFKEYIDLNNKLRAKPTVDQVADYPGKPVGKPGKENKHKDAGGSGQVGEIAPYMSGQNGKDPNKGQLHHGFANLGDKKLVYKAEDGWYGGKNGVSKSEQGIPGGQKAKDWVATKSEAWIKKTKDLSLMEFINKIKKEKKTPASFDFPGHKTIEETTNLCKENKKFFSDLLREMKRKEILGSLIKEALKHPDFLNLLATEIAENKNVTKKFFNCLNEMVGPPVGMDDEDIPSDDEDMPSDDEDMPSDDEDMPSDDEDMPSDDEDMPSDDEDEDDSYEDEDMPSDDEDEDDSYEDEEGDEELYGDEEGDEDSFEDEEGEDELGDYEDMSSDRKDIDAFGSENFGRRRRKPNRMSSFEDRPSKFSSRMENDKFELDRKIESRNPFYVARKK